ncbi:MAG: 30S ribosomal protein S4 [Peptoniphilus sp.]|uniref:Small ribosomal subunit protein uS4 n=2 Tax=Peptoniphilus indolicus TaxID=33030 RepID=G4D614_9FIRM|nr:MULTISPECIES: 30S ribosomal protein S4 [Peptoniphilus]EGY77469.1 30S ribosomal protein S4 [Peptoniphilus indolicus ATCC 29427]MDY2987265.1 30S ribosomal protein S4 [Peptoniphilus sp.]SUB74557.1 BS5 [Peptoniphilus indolicus]
MARMMVPRFKQSRRLGLNVCGHPKAMKRAVKGTARSDKKLTEYGKQLLEKQRLRAYYGVLEKQFVNLFKEAKKTAGQTGPNLVIFLERRLDNLAYRMGFASSIRQARQMVTHGHLTVNGKKVNIPSYRCDAGDVIELSARGKKVAMFKENFETNFVTSYPYISKEEGFKATLVSIPAREDVPIEIEDQLIVEFYSKNM